MLFFIDLAHMILELVFINILYSKTSEIKTKNLKCYFSYINM